jgi:hypothetical protein
MAESKGSEEISLQQLNDMLPKMYFKDPAEVAEELRLVYDKLVDKYTEDVGRTDAYAQQLTSAEKTQQDEFFSALVLMLDRQTDDGVREAVLNLVGQLVAIEKWKSDEMFDPPGGASLSRTALETLRDIMSSVVNIREPFVRSLETCLVPLLNEISTRHFFFLLPTLLQMVTEPKLGHDMVVKMHAVARRIADTHFDHALRFLDCKVLNKDAGSTKTSVLLSDQGAGGGNEQAAGDAGAQASQQKRKAGEVDRKINLPDHPRVIFSNMCRLMATCCEHGPTATEFDRSGVTLKLVKRKMDMERVKKETIESMEQQIAVHRLLAALARNSEVAADGICHASQVKRDDQVGSIEEDSRIVHMLYHEVRTNIEERARQRGRSRIADAVALRDTEVIRTLTSLLMRSKLAQRIFQSSKDIHANTFVSSLINIARSTDRGELIAAAIDGLRAIAQSDPALNMAEQDPAAAVAAVAAAGRGGPAFDADPLKAFRRSLLQECEIATKLIEIQKNLLSNIRSWGPNEQFAMATAVDLMRVLTLTSEEVGKALNKSDSYEGYDREQIVFRLLSARDDQIAEDVRLAAAQCLRSVPMDQFDKSEIQKVVNMISGMSALVTPKTYTILSNLVYLLFKMALDNEGVLSDSPEAADDSCGPVFRDVYATEVVSAIFGNLARCMEGDLANAGAPIEAEKRRFETACVKFLMTGWSQRQLREGLNTQPVLETLRQVLITEQAVLSRLRSADKHERERFSQHVHLFLEQSPVGFNTERLLECLKALRQRDVVCFRIMHQLANVLQARDNSEVLFKLQNVDKSREFESWHEQDCGRTIEEMASFEAMQWSERELNQLHPPFRIRKAMYRGGDGGSDDVAGIHDTISKHYRVNYDDEYTQEPSRIAEQLRKAESDARYTFLVMVDERQKTKDADGADGAESKGEQRSKIVAFVAGGYNTESENVAELFGVYINSEYQAIHEEVERAMIASFSHEMYNKGFELCVAGVRAGDRAIFSSVAESVDAKDSANFDIMNEKLRRAFIFKWSLLQNRWKENSAHASFVSKMGVRELVRFLCKASDESLQSFDDGPLRAKLRLTIRGHLEEFGNELINKFGGSGGAASVAPVTSDAMRRLANGDQSAWQFMQRLESEFKRPSAERSYLRADQPLWDSQLTGSAAENFVQTITLALLDGPPEEKLKEVDLVKTEEETKKKKKKKKKQRHRTKGGGRLPRLQFMGDQTQACIAAAFRAIHMSLLGGNFDTQPKALRIVRSPELFFMLSEIMVRIKYGIRESVYDALEDKYGVGLKFLQLVEDVIFVYPRQLAESLLAMELYEILTSVLLSMFDRLVQLIQSRNRDNVDPLHHFRALHRSEELLLARVCKIASEIINQVTYTQFFEGVLKVDIIRTGNKMCRTESLKTLFGGLTDRFHSALQVFLLYDAELSTGLNNDIADVVERFALEEDGVGGAAAAGAGAGAGARNGNGGDGGSANGANGPSLPRKLTTDSYMSVPDDSDVSASATGQLKSSGFYRDQMRTYVQEILGQLCEFNQDFRYNFVAEYCKAQAHAELGLRPSFVQSVLNVAQERAFRERLEEQLIASGVFTVDGEVVVDHAFVSHADLEATNLLVLSNHFYYLSSRTYSSGVDSSDMSKFSDLKRFSYRSVKCIHRGYGGQLFALERIPPRTSRTINRAVDVFLHRKLGVTERLIEGFLRFCKDDLFEQVSLRDDTFTKLALNTVCRKSVSTAPTVREHLYTHCWIMDGSRQLDRVLVLASFGDDMQIITASVSLGRWAVGPDEHESDNSRVAAAEKAASNYLSLETRHELKTVDTIEFTETPRPVMVIGFGLGRHTMTVLFKCDTAREQWRRALKMAFKQGASWQSSVLPDMMEKDRHSRKVA